MQAELYLQEQTRTAARAFGGQARGTAHYSSGNIQVCGLGVRVYKRVYKRANSRALHLGKLPDSEQLPALAAVS